MTRIRKTKYIISTIFFVADYVRMTALLFLSIRLRFNRPLAVQSLDPAFDSQPTDCSRSLSPSLASRSPSSECRRARLCVASSLCKIMQRMEQEATTEQQFHAAIQGTTVELRKRGEKEVFARRMKGVPTRDGGGDGSGSSSGGGGREDRSKSRDARSAIRRRHAIVTFCLRAAPQLPCSSALSPSLQPLSGSFLRCSA